LNYGRTDRYLKLLLNYGLLIGENDNPKKFLVYKLTPGGLELLSALSSVRKLLPKKIKLKRLNGI
jgi:predicted transcriptional regulator